LHLSWRDEITIWWLPSGYILPSEAKKMKDDKAEISIEDLVETERAALGPNTTKVTLETFMEWKKKKVRISHPICATTSV
jgi:hypothetical protein